MQYRKIAERLAEDIIRNRKSGERLPGVRELAEKEGVSLLTARNVYLSLKEKGLITVRQGSGTFVRSYKDRGHIDMASIGPPEEMLLWAGKYLNLPLEGLTEYVPSQGYEPLREQAGEWIRTSGIDSLPLVTSGSQQALFLAGLALLKPGDLVVVEDPCYSGAVRLFESLGAVIKTIPCITDESVLDEIKDESIALLYTMPQGHFPTGLSIPRRLKAKMLAIADQYDFYILEDDPVSDVIGEPPLKSLDRKDRVIYTKSLSNILGPGLRIGFSVVPDSLRESIIRLKEIDDLSISSMIQRMLHGMMSSNDFGVHIARLKSELKVRQELASELCGRPVRGLCLWLESPSPGRIVAERLLKEGIKVTPGDVYGPKWANHVRISLLRPSAADFPGALEKALRCLSKKENARLINLF